MDNGDIIGILDSSFTQVVSYTYDSWGKIISVTDEFGEEITDPYDIGNINSYTYRGYYYDSCSGLYYLNSRYYNPEWGRFLNADGVASTGQGLLSHNMYAYCLNNPVNRTDVDGEIGLLTAIIVGTIVGAVVGGIVGAVTSKNKTGSVQPKSVAKGAVIGGAVGAVGGVAVGTVAKVGAVAKAASATKALGPAVGTAATSTAPVVEKAVQKLQYSRTALTHLAERPYMNSPLTVRNIMEVAQPVQETIRTNILRWDVPGAFNGTAGIWELVYDTSNSTIYHFLFKGGK